MENDIIIKITGEADLDAAQKQLQGLTKRSDEYEKQIEQLKKAEKEDARSIKETVTDRKALAKALERNAEYYRAERKAVKDAAKANKQNIKALTDQVKAYKVLHGQSGRMVQQLRAMREELQRMEDAGQFGSEAFIELSIAAGKLEDQIGDTQQRIRILASDTSELDAAMGLGDGLAGSFYIATSAAEIFGDDMEGLQKAFYKVQAAMSIVSGITQVYNAVQKDSAANVVISNALSRTQAAVRAKEAVATGKATIAQRLYNKVLMSSPAAVVLAAVAALVAAYAAMSEVLGRVGDRQARLNKMQTESNIKALQDETRMRIKLMQTRGETALNVSLAEEKAAKDEMDIRQDAYDKAFALWEKSNRFNREKRKEELDEAKEQLQQARENYLSANEERLAQELAQEIDYRKQANQARVDILKEGASKEIAQIRLNYNEQLKLIKGNTEEEIALRSLLQKRMQKEIYEVRHKYQVQAQQLDIDIMRDGQAKEIAQINLNYAEQMRQYAGNSAEEIAIRKALKVKQAQEIADIERKYAIEEQKTLTEIDVQAMEERTKALKGNEGVEGQLKVWDDYYRAREYQLEENARLEIEEINRSTDNEEVKAARIKKIEQQYQADVTALAREEAEKRIEISNQEVSALELAADKAAHAAEHAQGEGRLNALRDNLDAQLALYDAQQNQIKEQYDAGLISYQDYKQQEWEIEKATVDAEVQYRQDAMQTIADGFNQALGYMQQISDMAFEAISNNIQAQLDELDAMYTTDWEEAQKNADKKYITEKEYEKKKAELQMRQAKYAKAQALTNIAIQTALAIMSTLAQPGIGGTPWGIAMAAIAGAMGAAQLAIAASKPLAQYEKGRNGGPGEYALVGEKGPEIMYIPRGASIVPNDKIETPAAWARYGVPELPHANPDTLHYAAEQTAFGFSIDYDRLGASVAAALPKQRNVTVNVDRSGVHVSDGRNNHTYLNTKYNGTWN